MTSIYQDNLQSRCPDLFNLAEYVLENANKLEQKGKLKEVGLVSLFNLYHLRLQNP